MKHPILILFTILLLFSFITVSSQSAVWIKYGECYKAMNYLKESVKNDSIAVSMFWKNYTVINRNINFLKKKTPAEVIEFFNREENKQLMCKHKRFEGAEVLLDDSNPR